MKKLLSLPLAIILALTIGATALAAYSADITFVNNTTTAYDMLSCNLTANIDYMAANNYFLGSEGLDTRVMSGVTQGKHMLADDRIMFSLPVPATSSQTLQFTSGSSNLTHFTVIPGYSTNSSVGYIEVADANNIELGDNFTVEQTGWIDTSNGTDKYLIHKPDAFTSYVSNTVSGNITSGIGTISGTWYSPTGFNDPSAQWSNETAVYDEDTGTYATELNIGTSSWSAWIELTRTATTIGSVRFWATAQNVAVNQVDIDVYYASAWHDGYQGSWTWGTWVEIPAYGVAVTNIRFRFYNSDGAATYDAYLYEVDYSGGFATSVTATGVSSGEHTVTTELGDTPYALSCTGSGTYIDGFGITLPSAGSFEVWAYFDQTAQARGAHQRITDMFYQHSANGWLYTTVSPYRHSNGLIPAQGWNYIVVTWTDVNNTSTVRWYVNNTYNAGSGGGAATMTFSRMSATGEGFAGDIDQVRISDIVRSSSDISYYWNSGNGRPFALDSNTVALWYHGEGVGTTTYDTANDYDGTINGATWATGMIEQTYLRISVDGTVEDLVAFPSGNITDTSHNWTIMRNNVMPYADNQTIWVGGTRELWFRPITIIDDINSLTANLTDRSTGTDNPGTIYWGANPSGINITLGSLSSDYEVSSVTGTETPDVLPVITTPTVTSDAAKTALLADDPFLPAAEAVEEQTGGQIPVLLQYWWGYLIMAILAFIIVYKFFPNLLVAGACFCAVIGFAVAKGIYDWWVMGILVLLLVGMALLENRRSPI